MVQNAVGKPVQGEDFFDRKREIEDIWSRLVTDDILLLAPRRVGKTSLMYRLSEVAAERGWQALYVSVADAQTELAFARKLLAEIAKRDVKKRVLRSLKKSTVAKLLRRVKKVGITAFAELELSDDAENHWAAVGESIIAALSATGSRWLILVDELPIFILSLIRDDETGARARDFLNWFRTLRQHAETARSVRWLLAGSIGLDTVTRRMNLGDTINDLFIHSDFGAFSKETACALLDELAATYAMTLTDEVKERICERTGWLIPYYLQVCFSDLRKLRSNDEPSVGDVDEVFESLLLPAKKSYFDYWRQRLHEELGSPDDGRALKILNAIAVDDDGASRQTLLAVVTSEISDPEMRDRQFIYLLDVLQSDGYVIRNDARYVFRSSLLRDYWRRNVLA